MDLAAVIDTSALAATLAGSAEMAELRAAHQAVRAAEAEVLRSVAGLVDTYLETNEGVHATRHAMNLAIDAVASGLGIERSAAAELVDDSTRLPQLRRERSTR
jgi:hypothetical protein